MLIVEMGMAAVTVRVRVPFPVLDSKELFQLLVFWVICFKNSKSLILSLDKTNIFPRYLTSLAVTGMPCCDKSLPVVSA